MEKDSEFKQLKMKGRQYRILALRAYCPNMYTVPGRMGAKLAQSVNYATTGC